METTEQLDSHVDSTSDERTVNNLMRHQYRVLDDVEKKDMQLLKDAGLEFIALLHKVGGTMEPEDPLTAMPDRQASAELTIAQRKIQEAVFWAVYHVTG